MGFSKVQIDARLALKSLASPRSRRAVYAPREALYFRYEGQQFFNLDFPTFTGLFAALTKHQLSAVAKAPDVIESGSWSRTTLDDSWSRLYREGRKSKPIWAALSLVEAAHHALTEALEAEDSPPQEVIETCNNHVRWLKDVLCRPDSRITELSGSVAESSLGTQDNLEHSRKRNLSSISSPEDTQCREKRVDLVQIEQDDAGCDALSKAVPQGSQDNESPAPLEIEQTVDGLANHSAPSPINATLNVVNFTTSKTPEPGVGLGSFRQFENGLERWVSHDMGDGWATNSLLQSSIQPRETQTSISTTTDNQENATSDDTTLELQRGPCSFQLDSMQFNNIQEIDHGAIWNHNEDVFGDMDSSPLFQ